jgi:hypothetical protein
VHCLNYNGAEKWSPTSSCAGNQRELSTGHWVAIDANFAKPLESKI